MAERIQSFKELRVYQTACELDEAIFRETKSWPKEEMLSLTSQIRRSSRAIGANIAESWAKRRYVAHFVSKLTDADAELQETVHWLGRAKTYGYLQTKREQELLQVCQEIGKMLGKMMSKPESFCSASEAR